MLVVAVLLVNLVAPPLAFGHGEGDSDQSLVLVRQAIAYLANKPGTRWMSRTRSTMPIAVRWLDAATVYALELVLIAAVAGFTSGALTAALNASA